MAPLYIGGLLHKWTHRLGTSEVRRPVAIWRSRIQEQEIDNNLWFHWNPSYFGGRPYHFSLKDCVTVGAGRSLLNWLLRWCKSTQDGLHCNMGTGAQVLFFCAVYLWLGHSSLRHRSGKFQNRSKGSSWMTYNLKVAWAAHGSTRHSTDSSLGIMGGMVSWTSDCPTLSEYVVTVLACISVTLSYRRDHAS